MSEKPFIVANEKGISALPHWLKKQGSWNSYSSTSTANGNISFSIGYNTGPNSDWGKWTRYAGIVVTKDELVTPAENLIRKHLRWELIDSEKVNE